VRGLHRERKFWDPVETDFYCPNKQNHSPKADTFVRPTQPRISDTTREPRGALLALGDRITHPVFGVGEVLAVQGEGEKAEATVKFDSGAVKTLATAWAPITKHE
jgi:hypothetical protein